MLADAEISELELRNVCHHEYAHAVVSARLGQRLKVAVWPNPNPAPDERTWLGQAWGYAYDLPRAHRRVVCLAGEIAVALLDTPDMWPEEFIEWVELGVIELSETDAAGAAGYTVGDIERTLALVRGLWPRISKAARGAMKLAKAMEGA